MFLLIYTAVLLLAATPGRPRRVRTRSDPGQCNVTIDGSDYMNGYFGPTSLQPPQIANGMSGKPLMCAYSFQGVQGQRVLIHVRKLSVGEYDSNERRCKKGHMKIWDGSREPGRHRYPPNVLCNWEASSRVNFRKFSTGPTVEMEFVTETATRHTSFQASYKFVNVDLEVGHHPHQILHNMVLDTGSASVCQWTISLEDCPGECAILSPGYPGAYPPNMECYYHVTSTDPDVVVQLQFRGNADKPREFGIRSTTECTEEYLAVYDGDSTKSPLIGSFCRPEVPDITASGRDLFMMFVTGPDTPPYGFHGFHLSALKMTQEWDQHSFKIPGKACDWIFNAAEGSMSSPDHWLAKKTSCSYIFNVKSGHYLELILNIDGLNSNCRDRIEIYREKQMIKRLCEIMIPVDKRPVFMYNVTGPEVTVVYQVYSGQLQSNPERGFWMSYRQIPVPTSATEKQQSSVDKEPQRVIDPASSNSGAAPWRIHLMHVVMNVFLLKVLALLCTT